MVKKFQINKYIHHLSNPDRVMLQQQITEEITDGDLTRYFGKNDYKNILKYSELQNYSTIQKLLPRNKSWKIILIESEFNSGHWVLLMRYNTTIEFFNSYGTFPSDELDYMPDEQNEMLDQDVKYLNILLTNAIPKFIVFYNKRKLQRLYDGVNTCGKWTILRLMMLKNFNMDLQKFLQFVDNLTKEYKLTPDEMVTLVIQK